MHRNLLACAAAVTIAAGGCATEATFTRTCYDVPDAVAEIRGDTVVMVTGVRYIDVVVGAGAEAATCTEVAVAYTGQLLDGSQFDEGTYVFIPGAGQVVLGFEQGVVGMREEGVRRVIIPPALGYRDEERKDGTGEVVIPANSTLVFDIEVLAVRQIGTTR